MCLRQIFHHPEAQKLQRTAVTLSASTAAISGSSVALFAGHHHIFLFGVMIGCDLILLTAALMLMRRAMRLEREL